MTILQLSPPIQVITPLGEGDGIFLIDYGIDHNTVWKVSLWDTGEVVNIQDPEIRLYGNEMRGIKQPAAFAGRVL